MKLENTQEGSTLINESTNEFPLYNRVAELIELARRKVATTVNLTMVYTYFEIGREIVEEEQEGKARATYGKYILRELSKRLIEKYGKGFSIPNLKNMRKFYLVYIDRAIPIGQMPSIQLQNIDNQLDNTIRGTTSQPFSFGLSWSHYLVLMRIDNPSERSFYEIETAANQWSEKELKRQYHSSLYERLALSRDKEEVMKLATQGNKI